jgi:hypothetical protein
MHCGLLLYNTRLQDSESGLDFPMQSSKLGRNALLRRVPRDCLLSRHVLILTYSEHVFQEFLLLERSNPVFLGLFYYDP